MGLGGEFKHTQDTDRPETGQGFSGAWMEIEGQDLQVVFFQLVSNSKIANEIMIESNSLVRPS